MTRQLPQDDADEEQFIQYRGPQTSVTHSDTKIRFETEHRGGLVAHKPLPVVEPDADPDDVPDDAVVRPVAEALVDNNPQICWGVACETCGDVFGTPKGESSHRSVHSNDEGDDGE